MGSSALVGGARFSRFRINRIDDTWWFVLIVIARIASKSLLGITEQIWLVQCERKWRDELYEPCKTCIPLPTSLLAPKMLTLNSSRSVSCAMIVSYFPSSSFLSWTALGFYTGVFGFLFTLFYLFNFYCMFSLYTSFINIYVISIH